MKETCSCTLFSRYQSKLFWHFMCLVHLKHLWSPQLCQLLSFSTLDTNSNLKLHIIVLSDIEVFSSVCKTCWHLRREAWHVAALASRPKFALIGINGCHLQRDLRNEKSWGGKLEGLLLLCARVWNKEIYTVCLCVWLGWYGLSLVIYSAN